MVTSTVSKYGLSIGSSRKTGTREELDIQQRLIDSAKNQGGYGRKVGNLQRAGISDLLLCVPYYPPIQMEVKDFSAVAEGFDRKTDVTVNQEKHINSMNAACRRTVACVGIRTVYRGLDRITLMEPRKRFAWTDLSYLHSLEWDPIAKEYKDLAKMFSKFGIARLE